MSVDSVTNGPSYEIVALPKPLRPLPSWHLDLPAPLVPCETDGAGRLHIRGWIAPRDVVSEQGWGIAVRGQGVTRVYPLNRWRGDVLRKVLGLEPDQFPGRILGFDWYVAAHREFDFGLCLRGELSWLRRLRLVDTASSGLSGTHEG